MTCVVITAATEPAVHLAEAQEHLCVENDLLDTRILACLRTAEAAAEAYTGRALLTSTWDLYLDDWPEERFVRIPKGRLQSVSEVKYYGDSGLVTWNASNYQVDLVQEPGRLALAKNVSWPSVDTDQVNPIKIRFVCGWTAPSAVPEPIKQAILLLVGHYFANREEVILGQSLEPKLLAFGADALLAPYRLGIW